MDKTIQNGGPPRAGASIWIIPDTLAGTAFYDAVAKTLRLAGSLSLKSPQTVILQFTDSQKVNSSTLSATVTVQFAFPQVVFFDTGPQSVNGGALEFTPPPIPVAGYYTISLGNQTLSGVFGYSLQFMTCLAQITPATASLTIGQTQSTSNPAGPVIVAFTAANGMNFNLVGGISDGTYNSIWKLGAVTALPV